MSHTDIIYDSDPHFTISPITRQIKNESSSKTTLVQGDHKSERFSFEMPRIIEGHDMAECNRIEIHYINSGISGESHKGIYDATDMHIHPEDSEKVVFSWLLWDCVTKYEGKLAFAIRFACVKNDIVEYEWNTIPNDKIKISKGIDNSGETTEDEEIPDLIAQWKEELFAEHDEMKAQIAEFDEAKCKAVKSGINGATIDDHTKKAQKIKVSIDNLKGRYAEIYVFDKDGNEIYYTELFPDNKECTIDIPDMESFEVSSIAEFTDYENVVAVEYDKYLTDTKAVEGSWVENCVGSAIGDVETALDNIIEIQNNLMGVSE